MRIHQRLWSLSLPILLAFACGGGLASSSDSTVGSDEDTTALHSDVNSTTLSELRIRADDLTLWMTESALQVVRGGSLQVVLRGRTSSNISTIGSSVPDDAFGRATQLGPRSFEITLRDGHEINTILSGLPLFLNLKLSNGKTYGAKLSLAARLAPSAGPVTVDPLLLPIYYRDTTSLRYRGYATTTLAGLSVTSSGGTAPSLGAPSSSRYPFDWEYDGLATLLDASSDQVIFATAGTTRQTGNLQLVVRDLGLGLGDPTVRWPTPACSRSVYDCIAATPTATRDLSSCGSYREVSRCIGADFCDVVPTPAASFALRARDASGLALALKAADDACPRTGGSWCSVGTAVAFDYPRCVAMTPTQAAVNEAALEATDRSGTFDVRYGSPLTRAELLMTQTFQRGLLSTIDAFAGDTDVRATLFESEEPCHNCHQFGLRFVLFYPRTQSVVVVDAGYGYDS